MSTRQIVELRNKIEIKKIVPSFPEIDNKKFPTMGELNDWDYARDRIYELLDGASYTCQSAVIQQYNEYIVGMNSYSNALAPISFISTDERNIPIIGFPYCEPIVKSAEYYPYNDEESLMKLGAFSAEKGINFETVRRFILDVNKVCLEYDLNSDDIWYNLTNIGYNPSLGLRVIDYGLVYGVEDRKFELVM